MALATLDSVSTNKIEGTLSAFPISVGHAQSPSPKKSLKVKMVDSGGSEAESIVADDFSDVDTVNKKRNKKLAQAKAKKVRCPAPHPMTILTIM